MFSFKRFIIYSIYTNKLLNMSVIEDDVFGKKRRGP